MKTYLGVHFTLWGIDNFAVYSSRIIEDLWNCSFLLNKGKRPQKLFNLNHQIMS